MCVVHGCPTKLCRSENQSINLEVEGVSSHVEENSGSNKSILLLEAENCRFMVPQRDTRFSEVNLKRSPLIGTLVQALDFVIGARFLRY